MPYYSLDTTGNLPTRILKLYDEKRIQFLEPFVKEEAARGIVGFSSFLNEKVEEIKEIL